MLKLANQIIDAYDDVDRDGLKKLAALGPKIDMMSLEKRASLKDGDFALTFITKKAAKFNKFPIVDHDSTWLSNQFFEMNCHKLPEMAAKTAATHIKTACDKFKVEPTPAVAHFATTEKVANNLFYEGSDTRTSRLNVQHVDLSKFAAADKIANNYTHAQYAMSSPAAVKLAAKYFDEHHKAMPVETRHKYAAAIQQRANELGMPAEKGTVSKYASDHYSGMVDLHIRSRLSLLNNDNDRQVLSKMAAMKTELPPKDFARALYSFDKKAGLSRYYGGHLTDPFMSTFAAAPDPKPWRVKVGSAEMTSDDLKRLAVEKYAKVKDYFGPHVADEFKRDPQTIFESLPMDSKEVLVGIANGTA